jgi:acyl-CoA dehydrogenase
MSDIRLMLVETVAKIFKDHCTNEILNQAEKKKSAGRLWGILEESGITLVGIDEEHGGSGGDLGDVMEVLKLVGNFAVPIPLAESIIGNMALTASGLTLIEGPSSIAPVLKNEQVNFIETTNGWVLEGQVSSIPWARNVNKIVVLGKTKDNIQLVTYVSPQECIIKYRENLAGEPRDEIIFNNIVIGKEHVARLHPNLSFEQIWQLGCLSRIVQISGALEKTLTLSVNYTQERNQFGKEIGKFQAIQQQLAMLAGEVAAIGILSDEASGIVSKIAHQVHGAMGFTDEYPLHYFTRRLWSWRDEYEKETYWASVLAEYVFEKQDAQLWELITSN